MAEQTPDGNGNDQRTDFLERRQRQIRGKGGSERSRGRKSLPPQRGVLKKIRDEDPDSADDGGKRAPMTREQMQRQAKGRTRRPSRGDFTDPAAERVKLERELALKRADTDRLQQTQAPQTKFAEEDAKRKAEEERKREETRQRAEEQRLKREKEEAEKKAEAQRKRQEREEARKRHEEERRKREKEEEIKRMEAEKQRQEKERERIFKRIEASKGKLNDEEREKAQKIADEMVKRDVRWEGYISLSGGIGGSMLR